MSNNEQYIRTCFEEMLSCFRDKRPQKALFTTFNFNPSFFENNILPMVCGLSLDEIKTGGATKRTVNELLSQIQVVVACDRTCFPGKKGPYNYGQFAVGVDNGRFHPKVILLQGVSEDNDSVCCFSIASANLSYSGWASNREAIAWSHMSGQHVDEIIALVKWLLVQAKATFSIVPESTKEEGDIRNSLQKMIEFLESFRHTKIDAAPQLRISIPGDNKSSIFSQVFGDESWSKVSIYSPYWGSTQELFSSIKSNSINLVLTRDSLGNTNFPWSEINYPNISYFEDSIRFTHAKTYLLEGRLGIRLCIGSANFSSAALGKPKAMSGEIGTPKNVEAVLVFTENSGNTHAFRAKQELKIEPSKTHKGEPDANEGAPPLPPFSIDVVYDWNTSKLHWKFIPIRRNVINATLNAADLKIDLLNPQNFAEIVPIKKLYRTFKVDFEENGMASEYSGIIYQVNAKEYNLDYHPRPKMRDILDMMLALRPSMSEEERKRLERRYDQDYGGEGDEVDLDGVEKHSQFDYFRMYQALYRFRKKLCTENQVDLIHAPTGVSARRLFDSVLYKETEAPAEIVNNYLLFSELLDIVNNKNAEAEWIEELKEALKQTRCKVRQILIESPQGLPGDSKNNAGKFLNWFEKERAEAWVR